MRTDYQLFKEFLEQIKTDLKKPTLLLHSCCGPCSSYVINFLEKYFDITIFYYNPNIYPDSEFDKRLEVQKELIRKMELNIKIIEEYAPHDVYLNAIKDSANLGEGSIRCYLCYEFRMKKLSEVANNLGFDYFTTVMSVSPYKNSEWINEIGKKYEIEGNHSKYLYSNFKKENGYKESIRLSREFDLYRQDWCGCEFSYKEHQEKIKSIK